jgi:uncharacterized circularly permuted ATP-grasp superfamily protein
VALREAGGLTGAVEAYHDLLDRGDLAAESAAALREGQRERGLAFGDRPLCVALRPRFISRARYDEVVAACRGVRSALDSLEEALLAEPKLRAELDLDPEEERLALADPGPRYSSQSVRVDGFLADTFRIIEYNAESPAGIAYSDALTKVFEELPVLTEFRRRYRLSALPVAHRQVEALMQAVREWRPGERPTLAIVDWRTVPTVSEFELFRGLFEAAGIPTVICEPAELDYRDGTLYAAGRAVNLVYRRVLTTELLEAGTCAALLDAYMDGAVCVTNTFRAKLLHKKMSLALLSDEAYASLYGPSELDAIRRHIPWTRKVRDGTTTRDGVVIDDTLGYVAGHRKELVLKPNDEYGGKGVVLGWTVSQTEWEQAVEVGASQSYVVQEAVEVPRERYPIALEGISMLDLAVDMNPYLFGPEPSGCLTRLSSSALLNVTAGEGSVVPTFVIEG